ncbi:hypothetical protein SNK03_003123 [Fusarium graminearum]|uniref:hypothetical protein n=1 Tax=Gibberella zeae (strain ATCC MYA-4620 / CBS 123657 / FGSC 9075 / NRRL 31084 / PH-1) TaxID=229533 RepID=UPI00021F1591|nr:hypothetical protein FGSG_12184 [Fusarium graminearum PH-1]ESU08195.1 hypothetical protein FGSG_12184 [Fusarium graminearum PH-1]|eukprot:XP_011318680.1 hypothetical protein FGSG_12184 [Fusarium graminearum PH-1]
MDRFAEQLFGKQDQSSRARLPEEPSFMETFAKNLAKSAAKSAAKRAMGQSSSEKRTRDWARGTSSNQINPEDFRGVAEFVIDLKTLKTELEAMSSTIISLNARGASHRDCEFYDRFVRKGGRLQDVIGSTLGQIRGLQDGDTEAEERRRKRDSRRREKR